MKTRLIGKNNGKLILIKHTLYVLIEYFVSVYYEV